ncbi:DUF3180 domain-containing protein [Psychromicrobium sp. YIM B11713]|uniref:DUF3180 domain-containing protein n=1 Tax=Psychromicrobium sp. YIM B11713 TaxID=3145233 RepID=UPI00374E4D51
MGVLKLRWLVIIALVTTVVGWLATVLTNRLSLPAPALPYTALITLALVILVVLILGLRVRSWRNGHRERSLNPLQAARTLILAQASAYTGAVILGWHLGVLIDALAATFYGASLGVLGLPAALAAGSLLMIGVGMLVERFCRIPPEDGADASGSSA